MGRILIVDDEAHITRVLAMWLNRNGHEVVEALNGEIALQKIRDGGIDLIISDMNMPVLDGIGLVKAVREDLNLKTPVLLLTARCDQANLIEKLKPYEVRLIPKPFTPSRLVADIDSILGASVP